MMTRNIKQTGEYIMKLFIIIVLTSAMLSYLSHNELESLQENVLMPYDRCIASYQGSELVSQCEALRIVQ